MLASFISGPRMRTCFIDCSPFVRNLFTPALWALIPNLEVFADPSSEAELVDRIASATVVLNGHTAMPAHVLRQCPELRSIVFLGTGASSYIDVEAARAQGIAVRTVAGYGNRTVAEHAMALLLAAARQIAPMHRALRAGIWNPLDGIELEGKRVGIIGTGGIGRSFMRIAAAFGMDTVAWNRTPPTESLPGMLLPLEELLATSDAVSLHLSLNDATRGFLDASRLARMKPGAILVNTARGALVDQPALLNALATGHLGHAALDVFDQEPLPEGHPLTRLENVTLTAHTGFKTPEATRRLLSLSLELAAADLAAFRL